MKKQKSSVEIFTPSWLSAILCAVGAVCIASAAILAARVNNSAVVDGLTAARQASTMSYQNITDGLASNQIINNLPLFMFWLSVGLIVYNLAIKIHTIFGNTLELKQTLGYANIDKRALLKAALIDGVTRLLAAIGWLAYLIVLVKIIVPYGATVSQASAQFSELMDGIYVLIALVVLWSGLYLNVLFMRIIALRTRLTKI